MKQQHRYSWRVSAWLVALGVVASPSAFAEFQDVPRQHWAQADLAWLEQSGWIEGWQSRFRGDKPATGYEMASLVHRFERRRTNWALALAKRQDTFDGRVRQAEADLKRIRVRRQAAAPRAGSQMLAAAPLASSRKPPAGDLDRFRKPATLPMPRSRVHAADPMDPARMPSAYPMLRSPRRAADPLALQIAGASPERPGTRLGDAIRASSAGSPDLTLEGHGLVEEPSSPECGPEECADQNRMMAALGSSFERELQNPDAPESLLVIPQGAHAFVEGRDIQGRKTLVAGRHELGTRTRLQVPAGSITLVVFPRKRVGHLVFGGSEALVVPGDVQKISGEVHEVN